MSLEEAMRQALIELKGVFAVAAISARDTNKIVAARPGLPVAVGPGEKEFFVASFLDCRGYAIDFCFNGH